MIDVEGDVIVITGAGRGLGRLYALDLGCRGASVVVNDLGGSTIGEGADRSVADAVVQEIREAGGRAVPSYASVTTPEGGAQIIAAAIDAFGRVDAVVSNAGILNTAPFDELLVEDWNRMIAVHLDGAFHVAQPAFRAMKAQGHGRFVFTASSAGVFGQHNSAHYAAAKAGILGLANVVAMDGAEHGIRANCILPFAYSRMVWEVFGPREELESTPGFLHAIEPDLVVPMVTFLASRACSLTHQNFSALAGRFARVFAGLADGWVAEPGRRPTAEDIATHLDEITSTEPFTVPGSIYDEVFETCDRLGI